MTLDIIKNKKKNIFKTYIDNKQNIIILYIGNNENVNKIHMTPEQGLKLLSILQKTFYDEKTFEELEDQSYKQKFIIEELQERIESLEYKLNKAGMYM